MAMILKVVTSPFKSQGSFTEQGSEHHLRDTKTKNQNDYNFGL